jgi:hypothetical protein
MSMRRLILTLAIAAFLLVGCSEDEETPAGPQPPQFDYYVDAASGDDNNPGSQSEPWKTITHAVSTADINKRIKVQPGTYDTALGETFPIELKEGQVLVGFEDEKGDGAEPTEISGFGRIRTGWEASVVGAEGSSISGFKIGESQSTHHYTAVFSDSITMQISFNTFASGTYCGIYIVGTGTTAVEFNEFGNDSYGVFMTNCPQGPAVRFNNFLSSLAIPINLQIAGSYAEITNNTITGNGQSGIQLQEFTSALIERNIFNQAGGYQYGAIRCYGGTTAGIRWNTFSCITAVIIRDDAFPTLGMEVLPGHNDFSAVTGACIQHDGSESIYAVGNTWRNDPPQENVDIIVNGSGMVIYGTGPDDHIP